jgi:cyclohexadieny/prephenate dehydrogenase
VVGHDRDSVQLEVARERGMADRLESDLEAAVEGAGLIVLATPVGSMPSVVRRLSRRLRTGAVLTDVGSVKRPLRECLPGLIPSGVDYLGSHPMVGGHQGGARAASPTLFEGAPVVIVPDSGETSEAFDRLSAFWEALGAIVHVREAEAHDAEVAWISHVPHVLAFAFARALRAAPAGAKDLVGPGFRDFTRIAHANPGLWADILSANAKALSTPLQCVAESFAELAAALEAGDETELERLLAEAADGLWSQSAVSAKEIPNPVPEASGPSLGDRERE